MIYGSVCSGIEAATVAAHPLGWRPAFFSEIEAFPRAVLQHHYPQVPLHGDFTTIRAGEYAAIDVLVGGTPCQSFSVAGLRGGLDDDRGNLALEYLRLADRLRPRWLVWENVPGVLSSNGGRDFGSILGGLGELGYGFAYRVLDAQFFGLAQRRRRVFVVGYLGDWRRAAAVLLERHSLSGNPAPSREAREGTPVSSSLRARANSSHRADSQAFIPDIGYALNAHGGAHGRQDAESETLIATTLRARDMARGVDSDCTDTLIAHTLKGEGFDASEDGTGRGTPIIPVTYSIMPQNSGKDYKARPVDVAQPLMASGPVGGDQGGDFIVQPFTIMERGRDGGSNLEYRQDGTANAILTPNGGRNGQGVGAVAFDLAQITSAANRTRAEPDLPASTLSKDSRMHVAGVTIHGTDKTANAASMTDVAGSLRTKPPGSVENSSTTAALHGSAVRRLTPEECEALQGFPRGYTDIPWRGKPNAPDGPRYKALGNSMAVPCMAWIFQRIDAVEALNLDLAA